MGVVDAAVEGGKVGLNTFSASIAQRRYERLFCAQLVRMLRWVAAVSFSTPMKSTVSVTQWIAHLKDGDHEAAAAIWRRYFERLVTEFCRRLSASGLVSSSQLQTIFKRAADQQPQTPLELARLLIGQGRLTKYQAGRIYRGKTNGLVLGDYNVLDEVGAGGMGQVFKARHRRMKRIVALKVLPEQLVNSPEAVRRFETEVEAAAQLEHPHIVRAYDAGEADGTRFLVMEYVDGLDLRSLIHSQGPLPVDVAIECIAQAARALAYAHAKGVVHRDIKPSNLMISWDEPVGAGTSGNLATNGGAGNLQPRQPVVRILDMGLARMAPPSKAWSRSLKADRSWGRSTT